MRLALIIIGSTVGIIAGMAGSIFAATQAFDTTKTEEHEFSQQVKEISIDSQSGDVKLVRGEGKTIHVREKRHYLGAAPDVTREVEDGVLELKSDCDSPLFLFCETEYTVEAPAGVKVTVRTNVGDIDLETRDRADVSARTNVGDIDVTVPKGTYELDANTDVGDVDLTDALVRYDLAKHSVYARTNVGDIDVDTR